MLSCREVTQLVSQSQDRRLAVGERMGLRMHLLMCNGCRNFSAQIGFMREAFERFRTNPPTDNA